MVAGIQSHQRPEDTHLHRAVQVALKVGEDGVPKKNIRTLPSLEASFKQLKAKIKEQLDSAQAKKEMARRQRTLLHAEMDRAIASRKGALNRALRKKDNRQDVEGPGYDGGEHNRQAQYWLEGG